MTETSRRDSWWRTAPVLTIAVLALVVSTAGGAYAVGKNSIGTKQLKKNAVTSIKIKNNAVQSSDVKNGSIASVDVKDGSLTAQDIAPGVLAPPPAAPSRTYFAKVGQGGELLAGSSGVLSVTKLAVPGYYRVQTSFDPAPCALSAAPQASSQIASANLESASFVNTVHVATQNVGGSNPYADGSFSLTIVC